MDIVSATTTNVVKFGPLTITAMRILWSLFVLLVGFTLIMSYSLYYHWLKYCEDGRLMKIVKIIYAIVTVFLLVGALFSIIIYSSIQ